MARALKIIGSFGKTVSKTGHQDADTNAPIGTISATPTFAGPFSKAFNHLLIAPRGCAHTADPNRAPLKRTLSGIALALCLTHSLPAVAAERSMMNAWELGSLNILGAYTNAMLSDLSRFERAWRTTQHHRKMKAGHDHFAQTKEAACRLSFRWINTLRARRKAIRRQAITYKMDVPRSLEPLRLATKDAFTIADDYLGRKKDCAALSLKDFQRFITATRTIRKRKEDLDIVTRDRRRKTGWSTTFAVELSPLPFKLEVIEGSAKLKIAKSFGPLKFDLQTGPKLQRYRPSGGLKYLIVRTPDKLARVFDVQGMELELAIPASIISFSGATLMITCSQTCLNDLKETI